MGVCFHVSRRGLFLRIRRSQEYENADSRTRETTLFIVCVHGYGVMSIVSSVFWWSFEGNLGNEHQKIKSRLLKAKVVALERVSELASISGDAIDQNNDLRTGGRFMVCSFMNAIQ